MKLNIEQEIMNLKATIEDREEEAAKKQQLKLMRKYLSHSYQISPLSAEEAQFYG